ncbi:MAG: TRAP transporter substrate-binding protein [Candidatus Asgardarchaeum sp.]
MKKDFLSIFLVLVITTLFFCLIVGYVSAEQEITFKFAHEAALDHPENKAAERMKAVLSEKSNGRINMVIYPSAQLGSSQQRMTAMITGAIQMGPIATFGTIEPRLLVVEAPYIFVNDEEMVKFQRSDAAMELLALLEKHGIHGMGWEPIGFRNIGTVKKPVYNIDDLKNLTIRAFENKMLIDILEALGANVTVIPYAELYLALQTGTIDGEDNPYHNKVRQKFYEVEKYIIESHHMCGFTAVAANKKWWDGLSSDDQKIINDAFQEYLETYNKNFFEDTLNAKQLIIDSGVTIVEIEDYQPWKDAVKDVYSKYEKEFGVELMEKIKKAIQ